MNDRSLPKLDSPPPHSSPNTLTMILVLFLSIALLRQSSSTAAQTLYDVTKFGADSSGTTDSSNAINQAWGDACSSGKPATVYVPAGTFLAAKQVYFKGPCDGNKKTIKFEDGASIVGSKDYNKGLLFLLLVEDVKNDLTISNGAIDGQGGELWACKKRGQCPNGATSLAIVNSNNITVEGWKSYNSQLFHITVIGCQDVRFQNIEITADGTSVNTDGIHVQGSTGVTIIGATIKTGDDCISLGAKTENVYIQDVNCGPGHGISIGSLGLETDDGGVNGVVVKGATFNGSTNGFRIKTWAKPSNGLSVNNVTFQDSTMINAMNPILIDQKYCSSATNCPTGESSGVSISQVTYNNIKGSSGSPLAVRFDCSSSKPCQDIKLEGIGLTYNGGKAQSFCAHASITLSGLVDPPVNC